MTTSYSASLNLHCLQEMYDTVVIGVAVGISYFVERRGLGVCYLSQRGNVVTVLR